MIWVHRRFIAATATLLGAILLASGPPAGGQAPAPTLPEGFEVATVVSGLTRPTAIDWAPDGRMFIAEKSGRVLVLLPGETTARTVIDITTHVNSQGDRGLTGIAVDRDFATNGYLWLLYVYENNANAAGAKTARLSRITIAPDSTVVNPSSPETVVLGTVSTPPCPAPSDTVDCISSPSLSHTVGTVRSDPTDGTLWVGSGDSVAAGAFNLNTYNEQSFAGKLIHIDRTGRGLPGHPFCPTDNDLSHVCTKIHAKGLRNPFRFTLRPGKPPVAGDVGWNTREEIDLVEPGKNYGWPCYEGAIRTPGFSSDTRCAPIYAAEGTPEGAVPPLWDCERATACSTVIVGPRYTATAYPPEFHGDVFFGDYTHGWIRHLELDGADRITSVADFAAGLFAFVDLELAPNGNLTYADVGDFDTGTGSIRQIKYTPFNRAPTAQASADRTFGAAPLHVAFNGSSSTDPEGDPLTYDWDFGDGSAHNFQADPVHTYADGTRNFTARLTVSDGNGSSDTATVEISPGNTPPHIDSLTVPATYRDGIAVTANGAASDAQDGSLTGSALGWRIRLRHAEHFHDFDGASGGSTSFTPQTDHDADSNYDVIFTATDSRGLTDSRTVNVRPETVLLTLASSPAGAPLTYGSGSHTAPFSTQSAIGYRTSISAAAYFTEDGTLYEFDGWSDGSSRVHEITIPARDATLTVSYRAVPPGYRRAVLGSPSLISYWRLGEPLGTTAFDELERHPGSYLGGVSLAQAGALAGDPNTAAGFDGSNDELTLGGGELALNPGTVEGWFHWEAGVTLMRDSTPADNASFILAYDSAGRLAYRVAGRTFVTARSTVSLRNGWHHLALTRSGGSATLYVDGQPVHNATGIPNLAATPPWHGMRNGKYNERSRGRADEIAFYGTALSAQAIADHYAAGSSSTDTTPPAIPSGLAATAGSGSVALEWSDNTEPDLGGYDVYRSTTTGGTYAKLNATPLSGSNYTDSTAQNGTTYHYVIRAVDTSGNASGDSGEASATPSAPPVSSYEDAVRATAGLKGYWRLGEPLGTTALDELGRHQGSYLGGVSLGRPGAIDGDPDTAAGFDGINDELTLGGSELTPTTSTLEGWFYWEGGVALMRDSNAVNSASFILAYDSAGKLAYRVAGRTFVTTRTTASLRNGWHHLAVTSGGGSATLYVDGQAVHNATGIPIRAATPPWHVMRNGVYNEHSRGRADEIAIYDRRLDPGTVAAHQSAGR